MFLVKYSMPSATRMVAMDLVSMATTSIVAMIDPCSFGISHLAFSL